MFFLPFKFACDLSSHNVYLFLHVTIIFCIHVLLCSAMSVIPLIVDIATVCVLVAFMHYHYGNWRKHHIIVTVATFLAWFLPFMIIFVLPIDVSSVSINFLFFFVSSSWTSIYLISWIWICILLIILSVFLPYVGLKSLMQI